MGSGQDALPRTLSLAVHELRTPLTVASGYLRMLLREQAGPLQDGQRRMLQEVERSCGRLTELVAEMHELGRLESGQLAVPQTGFDLAVLMAEVAADVREGGERGIRLEVSTPDPLPVVGDRARIAAAARALIHATVRERGEPGVVAVVCSSHANAGTRWAVASIGDQAVLAALQESIADTPPFDEWRGGTGLAVPIGRRIVEAHGGAVWSARGPNPRAGVAFRLPLAG